MCWRIPRFPVAFAALAFAASPPAAALVISPAPPPLVVPVNTAGTADFTLTTTQGYTLAHVFGDNAPGWSFSVSPCNPARTVCGLHERFAAGALPGPSSSNLGLIECPTGGGGCPAGLYPFTAQAISTLQRDAIPLPFGDVAFEDTTVLDVPITIDTGYRLASASLPFPEFGFGRGDCPATPGPFSCTATLTLTPAITAIYNGTLVVTECPPGGGTCLAGSYRTTAHVLPPAPSVPEPAALALLAPALLALAARRRG